MTVETVSKEVIESCHETKEGDVIHRLFLGDRTGWLADYEGQSVLWRTSNRTENETVSNHLENRWNHVNLSNETSGENW